MYENETYLMLMHDVELDPDYEWTIDFPSKEIQYAYFKAHEATSAGLHNRMSKIRRQESIKVDIPLDELEDVNYLFFMDEDTPVQSGFKFCAFVLEKKYISTTCTEIFFKIDVMQTYLFYHEIQESFVDREHQDRWKHEGGNKYKAIFNLENENLDYGKNYIVSSASLAPNKPDVYTYVAWVYIYMTKPLAEGGVHYFEGQYETGFYVYMLPIILNSSGDFRPSSIKPYFKLNEARDVSKVLTDELLKDPSVFQICVSVIPPCNMITTTGSSTCSIVPLSTAQLNEVPIKYIDDNTYIWAIRSRGKINNRSSLPKIQELPRQEIVELMTVEVPADKKFEPKLKIYPYNFKKFNYGTAELIVKNEGYKAGSAIYGYQSLSGEATSAIYLDDKYEVSRETSNAFSSMNISVNQLPLLIDLNSDKWTNYLLENKNQRMAGFITEGVTSGLSAITAPLTGGGLGLVGGLGIAIHSGARIFNQLARESDIKNQPDDTKQFNGDMSMDLFTNGYGVKLSEYHLEKEYSDKLYKYFQHYGYKANTFKVPNTKSRYYYNYIKLIGANIKASIDNTDLSALKDIYENGITFWHYRDASFRGVNKYDKENVEMSIVGGDA